MQLAQISSQLNTPSPVVANEAEEGLMIDNRCGLKPAEHVDRKLHSLLGDRFSQAAGRSDVRMVSRRAR